MRRHAFLSLTIGLAAGLAAYFADPYHAPGDWWQAVRPTQLYLQGRDPLTPSIDPDYVPNPVTIIPFGLPLAFVEVQLAGALFFGASSALLTWSLRKRPYLLPLFVSFPFVQALGTRQYSPLLMSFALTDLAVLGLLIKPNIALPLVVAHRSHPVACGVVLGVSLWSLLTFGLWPIEWLPQLRGYTGTSMLVYPAREWGFYLTGIILLLTLGSRRWMLAAYLIVPTRGAYDGLPLFLEIKSWRAALGLAMASWIFVLVAPSAGLQMMVAGCLLIQKFQKKPASGERESKCLAPAAHAGSEPEVSHVV